MEFVHLTRNVVSTKPADRCWKSAISPRIPSWLFPFPWLCRVPTPRYNRYDRESGCVYIVTCICRCIHRVYANVHVCNGKGVALCLATVSSLVHTGHRKRTFNRFRINCVELHYYYYYLTSFVFVSFS